MSSSTRILRWGILGTGTISGTFADQLATLGGRAEAAAVGSRNAASARAFADSHRVSRAHGSYQAVLDDPAVDAIYLGLVNQLHAEWAIKAAQAGKHVLCEKPACMTRRELDRVLAAVRKHDVFFMEAFMYRCHPRWAELRRLLAGGIIGELRMLQASFAFDCGSDRGSRLLEVDCGGGALMDIGVYPVSWMRMICGEEPFAVRALGHLGSQSKVDEWTGGVLSFPGGTVGTFSCAIRCAQPAQAVLYGSDGWISCDDPWFCKQPVFHIHRRGRDPEALRVDDDETLYAREALTVAAHLDARQAPAMTHADSLGQARVLDELRHQVGLWWPGEK